MRNIFIINPKAGRGLAPKLIEEINSMKNTHNIEIYTTKDVLDAKYYTEKVCRESTEKLRIYACGGDGTLNEVVNGAYGYHNVEIGCIPMGSGNDFIRNFGEAEIFRNIKSQLDGESIDCDLIKYTSDKNNGYFVNMCNIGFDSNVVEATAYMKRIPFVHGSFAYMLGIISTLIKKKGANLSIVTDRTNDVYEGKLLMATVANGMYCGGGIKGVPRAMVDDGLIDLSIIKTCSRMRFIKLFSSYKKGVHLELDEAKDLIIYRKEKHISIKSEKGDLTVCFDGELEKIQEIEFDIIKNAMKFIIPK